MMKSVSYVRHFISGGLAMACLWLFAVAPAAADTSFGYSIGVGTDDYLGRRAADGSFGFNGLAFSASYREGTFEFDARFGQSLGTHQPAISEVDLGVRFGGGNWKAGVGKRDRHWSPSKHSSLILSRNAPSFWAAYIAKTQATQSASAAFRWLGPWRGEFFVGTTRDANQPDGAMIAGMQLAFQPLSGFDVELVRVVQFGGKGQSSGFGALLGRTNEGLQAGANQIAGIGLSYAPPGKRARYYAQVVGEDEAGGLPSCLMYLAGIELTGRMFAAPTTISLEAVDTRIDQTRGGNCGPNTAYNNSVYSYVNDGVDLGAVIGSEGRSIDLRVRHEFPNWTLDWGAGYYQINDASDPNHRLSSAKSSGAMLSAGVQKNVWGGTLNAKVVYQGFDLDTADLRKGLKFGLGFSKSF